jgi:predicted nucleic acid-binding protein
VIVDTSVVIEALIPSALSGAALKLLTSTLAPRAPDFLLVELAGALTKAVRRRDITAEFAAEALASSHAVLPQVEPTRPLIDRAFVLSLELTHPLYDCLFLAQAERRAMPLVTADRRFVDKLKGTAHAATITHLADWRP